MKVHLTPEEKILERSLKGNYFQYYKLQSIPLKAIGEFYVFKNAERGVRKPRERMKPKITEGINKSLM